MLNFFDKLWTIKKALEERGHEVLLPSMKDFSNRGEDSFAKVQYDLIRSHFNKIDQSDAIYVANFEKNGVSGYIGGNSFLEMGKAFDKGLKIFLLNQIPQASYRDELIALKPIVIGENWDLIKKN